MIKPPHRSVTRFFIPLIDVLTLLFCIFLVMPQTKEAVEAARAEGRTPDARVAQLEAENKKLREQVARLEKNEVKAVLDRLAVGVVQVGDDGSLYYLRDNRDKRFLTGPADVERMAGEDRARAGGRREWLYVLRLPEKRDVPHPNLAELREYFRWFADARVRLSVEGDPGDERKGRAP
jgi:hypothetical protein